MIIYKITNLINEKIYIGQSKRTIQDRMPEHIYDKRRIVGQEICKYGVENFKIEVIDKADSVESLNEKEKYWIGFFNCIAPFGYNLQYGGQNGKECDITRHRISKNNGMKGVRSVNAKEVLCKETGKTFPTITDAAITYGLKSKSNIVDCCKGLVKHAGKLNNGIMLSWEYVMSDG